MDFASFWEALDANSTQLRLVAGFLTLLIAAVSAVIALTAIETNKQIAKQRATLDMLTKIELDKDYINRRRIFISVVNSDTPDLTANLRALLDSGETYADTSIPKIEAVRVILDIYELLAISIANETLDQNVYYAWFRGPLVGDWKLTRDFIVYIRKEFDNPNIYSHFEWLAVSWGGEPTSGFRKYIKPLVGKPLYVPPSFLMPR